MHLFDDDPDPLGSSPTSWLGGWHRASAPQVLKTSKGLGYVMYRSNRRSYILRMIWTNENGHWIGCWKWFVDLKVDQGPSRFGVSCGQSTSETRDDGAEHCQAPPELLLMVCEHAVAATRPQKGDSGTTRLSDWNTPSRTDLVRRLALTCRGALYICAHVIYLSAEVHSENVDAFIQFLREEAVYIPKHAGRLILHGSRSWSTYMKLARVAASLLPGVSVVSLQAPSHLQQTDPPLYYPTYPHLASLLRYGASSVSYFTVKRFVFASSLDILRLLAAFPCLEAVRLEDVRIPKAGDAVEPLPTPFDCSSQLGRILIQCPFDLSSALAMMWKWGRMPSDQWPGGFPGVHANDARAMVTICQCLRRSNATSMHSTASASEDIRLDVSLAGPGKWVAWVAREYSHVEFHLDCGQVDTEEESRTARTLARVRHVVVRVRQLMLPEPPPHGTFEQYVADSEPAIVTMEHSLQQFPHLRSVVLESEYGIGFPFQGPFARGIGMPHRSLDGKSVERACTEGQHLALGALRRGTAAADTPLDVPISPFWYLTNYENQWERWTTWSRYRGIEETSVEWPYPTVL